MTGRVAKFLERLSNIPVQNMPLVHTTPAYFLRQIFDDNRIRASECNFFDKEKLSYFFLGRPAYKWQTEGDASDWELPVCFVFEYNLAGLERVYPFDSGAYLSRRLPKYITMMPLEEFELSGVLDAPGKIIAAYFSTKSQYFHLRPKSENDFRESLSVDDVESEVRALHKLYSDTPKSSDDRRATIEIQFSCDIELSDRRLLALIIPDIYLSNESIQNYAKTNKVSLITYETFPLNSAAFTAIIYEKLKKFYKSRRMIL